MNFHLKEDQMNEKENLGDLTTITTTSKERGSVLLRTEGRVRGRTIGLVIGRDQEVEKDMNIEDSLQEKESIIREEIIVEAVVEVVIERRRVIRREVTRRRRIGEVEAEAQIAEMIKGDRRDQRVEVIREMAIKRGMTCCI